MIKQLMSEVKSMRSELKDLRVAINEIDLFQHRNVRPEYIEKLKKTQSQKGKVYMSVTALHKELAK